MTWRQLAPAELEREYSPSSCLDGPIDPEIQAYIDRSEHARAWCEANAIPITTIRYGPRAANTVDLVVPHRDGGEGEPPPLVVYIHGGYWQQLSKVESFFAAADCIEHGIAFAAVDYTLAPEATLDQIVAECRAAVAQITDHASDLGIDAGRVLIAGSSAGAHLTATVSLDTTTDWRPAFVVLASGVFDLEPLITTSINDAVGLDLEAAERNSPALADLTGFPATSIVYGDNETSEFKRQSDDFAALLVDAGVPVTSREVLGRNHFDVIHDLIDLLPPTFVPAAR